MLSVADAEALADVDDASSLNGHDLHARTRRTARLARLSEDAVERDFGAGVRGEEPGGDLVVSQDGHPIGLLQRSVIGDYPER